MQTLDAFLHWSLPLVGLCVVVRMIFENRSTDAGRMAKIFLSNWMRDFLVVYFSAYTLYFGAKMLTTHQLF